MQNKRGLSRVPPDWPKEPGPSIAFVGEAPDEKEAIAGHPFVGGPGRIFNWFLASAGVKRDSVYVGNSFRSRPPENKIAKFFVKKAAAKKQGIESNLPPCGDHGLVLPEHEPDVLQLIEDLNKLRPNIIVAMGNTAMWALTGIGKGITEQRGYIMESTTVPGTKVIPTFHPASVMLNWNQAALVGMDFTKAVRESAYPEVRRPLRELWIEPTIEDIRTFYTQKIRPLRGTGQPVAADVETVTYFDPEPRVVITCIGFAPSPDCGISIPFRDARMGRDGTYWSVEQEAEAWGVIEEICGDPDLKLVFQNGPYDIQVLLDHGVPIHHVPEDTMICHHAKQIELPKGLGVLASLYTDEVAWKMMVNFKKAEYKPED